MADTDNFYEGDEMPVGSFNFYKGHEQAISDITVERLRQVGSEGWTPKHDDDHNKGEISAAAAAYAKSASSRESTMANVSRWERVPPPEWPWDSVWWKPSDARRELVKAAALIVAEIERLDRVSSTPT